MMIFLELHSSWGLQPKRTILRFYASCRGPSSVLFPEISAARNRRLRMPTYCPICVAANITDSRAILRKDIGFYMGLTLGPLLKSLVSWNPCPLIGLPETLPAYPKESCLMVANSPPNSPYWTLMVPSSPYWSG